MSGLPPRRLDAAGPVGGVRGERPRRRRALLLALCVLAGCRTLAPQEDGPRRPPSPPVDEACLARAKANALLEGLPSRAGDFVVSRTSDTTFAFDRPGRPLTEPEGRALWAHLGERGLPTGLVSGSAALFGTTKCPGVPDASCLTFTLSLCQTSPERLAAELAAALMAVGAGAGALRATFSTVEQGGPACKAGPACAPTPHASTARLAPYRAGAPRRPLPTWSVGACADDGDCEGGGNSCRTWYLRGGAELLILIQYQAPTFCGCVEGQCTWFTQD